MARVGLSKAYYAKYAYSQGAVTYSEGASLGKAVETSIEPEDTDADIFYADNGPAESATTFGGGELTITVDRMSMTALGAILGLTVSDIMESTTKVGTHMAFPADLTTPYVGYATIRKDIVGGVASYTAIILYKVQFKVPSVELSTQGETVEFEGNELSATILRNDATPAQWMDWAEFATETAAENYIKSAFSIT